ncbi:MAG: MarR family transcriptional regulator [Eubacteriales bacterium]|nr:MarR family transcriptional regulator [Eubacteriales bacterium]
MQRISEGKGSQKRILMLLKENGDITQRELTEYLGIQPGSASEVIGKLEAAGLILRTPSQTDRRTMDICLTQAGQTAASEAYEKREQRHQKMFACLSEEEKQTLLELLEKINMSWNQQYRKK